MRLAAGGEHLHAVATRDPRNLAHQTALADARRPCHANHRAVPVDGTVQQTLDGGHLPTPTNKIRLSTPGSARPVAHGQQPTGGHCLVGTLDLDQLRFAEVRSAIHLSLIHI